MDKFDLLDMRDPSWFIIYKKLAIELKKFYDDCESNKNSIKNDFLYVGEEFFAKCMQKEQEFYRLFNWGKNISEKSLDPFHIFVSFNNNNTTLNKKIERMQFYFDVLNYQIDVKQYLQDNRFSVPHIPVMMLLTNREKEVQNEIWKFFVGIINNDEKAIKNGFEDFKNWFGIGFVVITEMLFWVDSSKYISLDKNTSKLLLQNNVIESIPKNFKEYKTLVDKREQFNSNIFRLIVKYAYDNQTPKNSEDKKQLLSFLNKIEENMADSSSNFNGMNFSNFVFAKETIPIKFQLIALKVLEKQSNDKYIKNLKLNELYQFNKNFKFENNQILYNRKKDIDLYKVNNIDININVIVGENGSGKSTLLELAFMIINNVSRKIFEREDIETEEIKIDYISGICAELYFITDHLYKIKVFNNSIEIQKFEKVKFDDEVVKFGEVQICTNTFNFDNLYYTNHINYSLHSLNQNYFGSWIHKLFHKNDGYKTPIVLEPYRRRGNIDINLLQSLMKNRLLSYILHDESFRQLTKKAKAEKIILRVDYFKFTSYEANLPSKDDFKSLLSGLKIVFDYAEQSTLEIINDFIDNRLQRLQFDRNKYNNEGDKVLLEKTFKNIPIEFFLVMYIHHKLDSIVEKYEEYSDFKDFKVNNKLALLLETIKKDTSHITFKIRQAIYNLKYLDLLKYRNSKMTLKLDELSNTIINEILTKGNTDLRFEDLIPSSIFKVDIVLENNEKFDSLSSGEKQKIFVINSIMYHLKNIASKDSTYRNVNIVLDEIELYFHPEMQKDFIYDLLFMLKNNEYIYNLSALNFMFITHSPFILSDVMDNNLLKLDEHANPIKENQKTFGSNIYDLLHDSFFMDEFIGKFAENKIKQIIDIIKLYKILQKEGDKNKFKKSYDDFFGKNAKEKTIEILAHIKESKNELLIIVDEIGEPILRNKLADELKSIFENYAEDDLKDIVNKLKNKNYEEILKELQQYSNEKQKKILNLLFENNHD